jgi:hypothetical protein
MNLISQPRSISALSAFLIQSPESHKQKLRMGRCAASLALPALMLASSAAAFAPPSGAGVLGALGARRGALCGGMGRAPQALRVNWQNRAGGLRMQEEQGYTKKQILREEIEAPFRKVLPPLQGVLGKDRLHRTLFSTRITSFSSHQDLDVSQDSCKRGS